MVNINKLKGKIVERGFSIGGLAKEIGISQSALYRKLKNNGDNISIKEARLMIAVLNLNPEEVDSIFFSEFVAYNAKKIKERKN